MKRILFLLLSSTLLLPAKATNNDPLPLKFDFGKERTHSGYTAVRANMPFTAGAGFGFEPGALLEEFDRGGDALAGDFITGTEGFKFSVALPEGNYRITLTLGDLQGESATTIKTENRRLAAEHFTTPHGEQRTVTFLVNTRTPKLSPGNSIKLDSREWNDETGQPLTYTWDDKLTLHFSDTRPCVAAIEIEKAEDAVTVFIIGDSTVTDQGGTTSGTWGQTLSRWLKDPVVVANHAESGETLKAFRFQRRWDKVMEEIKPGDYVFMQFGHNDSKSSGHDGMWPPEDKAGDWISTHSEANTDYIWGLATNAVEIMRRGGIPVIVSPLTRINQQTGAVNIAGHGDYPAGARKAAELAGCAFIDLNGMSIDIMQAMGPEVAKSCYLDGTHTSVYGGYLLSRALVEGIKANQLPLVEYLTDDAGSFDPKHPQPAPNEFRVPADPPGIRKNTR